MNHLGLVFRQEAICDPRLRLPGHGRRPKDRSRPSWVVDVVRLEEEAGTALQRLLDQILLRKDRRDQAMCVLGLREGRRVDRKSTRLNSSHLGISYAVFCLKKKNAFLNILEIALCLSLLDDRALSRWLPTRLSDRHRVAAAQTNERAIERWLGANV